MFKFLTKQLIYGRIYLWAKDKLGAILFLFISIFCEFFMICTRFQIIVGFLRAEIVLY